MKKLNRSAATLMAIALALSFGVNSAQASKTIALSETSINKTISVKVGTHITLALHSMYWTLLKIPPYQALTQKGSATLKPILPGPGAPKGCTIPGSGCGTQSWKFVASKVGMTHLIARRTTCGEAMRCTGTHGRFEVTVKVIR